MEISERKQRLLLACIGVLIVALAALTVIGEKDFDVTAPSPNRLVVPSSPDPSLTFPRLTTDPVAAGANLDEMIERRYSVLLDNQRILWDSYQPADVVFGAADERLPWVSQHRLTFGKHRLAELPSPPAAWFVIANPFLLLYPSLRCKSCPLDEPWPWSYEVVNEAALREGLVPTSPAIETFQLDLGERVVTASFNVTAFLDRLRPWLTSSVLPTDLVFAVDAINAKDFNLRWIKFNDRGSHLVSGESASAGPIFNMDHYSVDTALCAAPCNHRSAYRAGLSSFSLAGVPARAEFKLFMWKPGEEQSLQTPAFTMVFDFF